ncbi:uncharacterized protein LOC143462858 isoform X1 [Clavelina lepadiformis]|uniref:uncharacterized protein LOC143462858 isoform X1 n=2 Tax=Clavelina lepadiformis TaxID=159417 RepID=UPI00404176A8
MSNPVPKWIADSMCHTSLSYICKTHSRELDDLFACLVDAVNSLCVEENIMKQVEEFLQSIYNSEEVNLENDNFDVNLNKRVLLTCLGLRVATGNEIDFTFADDNNGCPLEGALKMITKLESLFENSADIFYQMRLDTFKQLFLFKLKTDGVASAYSFLSQAKGKIHNKVMETCEALAQTTSDNIEPYSTYVLRMFELLGKLNELLSPPFLDRMEHRICSKKPTAFFEVHPEMAVHVNNLCKNANRLTKSRLKNLYKHVSVVSSDVPAGGSPGSADVSGNVNACNFSAPEYSYTDANVTENGTVVCRSPLKNVIEIELNCTDLSSEPSGQVSSVYSTPLQNTSKDTVESRSDKDYLNKKPVEDDMENTTDNNLSTLIDTNNSRSNQQNPSSMESMQTELQGVSNISQNLEEIASAFPKTIENDASSTEVSNQDENPVELLAEVNELTKTQAKEAVGENMQATNQPKDSDSASYAPVIESDKNASLESEQSPKPHLMQYFPKDDDDYWTDEEDAYVILGVQEFGLKSWVKIANLFPFAENKLATSLKFRWKKLVATGLVVVDANITLTGFNERYKNCLQVAINQYEENNILSSNIQNLIDEESLKETDSENRLSENNFDLYLPLKRTESGDSDLAKCNVPDEGKVSENAEDVDSGDEDFQFSIAESDSDTDNSDNDIQCTKSVNETNLPSVKSVSKAKQGNVSTSSNDIEKLSDNCSTPVKKHSSATKVKTPMLSPVVVIADKIGEDMKNINSPIVSESSSVPILNPSTPTAKRRKWSEEADGYIICGVDNIGLSKWAMIQKAFPFDAYVTGIRIKDRWRSLLKLGLVELDDEKSISFVDKSLMPWVTKASTFLQSECSSSKDVKSPKSSSVTKPETPLKIRGSKRKKYEFKTNSKDISENNQSENKAFWRLWSPEQDAFILLGVLEFGLGSWAKIGNEFSFSIETYHTTIKDRWRVMLKHELVKLDGSMVIDFDEVYVQPLAHAIKQYEKEYSLSKSTREFLMGKDVEVSDNATSPTTSRSRKRHKTHHRVLFLETCSDEDNV